MHTIYYAHYLKKLKKNYLKKNPVWIDLWNIFFVIVMHVYVIVKPLFVKFIQTKSTKYFYMYLSYHICIKIDILTFVSF